MRDGRDRAPEIGGVLRETRRRLGLSLEQAASRSGVSKSMLSQIERGQTNPTFATLWALTQGYGLDLQDLVARVESPSDPVELLEAHFTPTLRSPDGRCLLRILSPLDASPALEWYELVVEPGGALRSEPHARGTREHLSVLEGRLWVSAGAERLELATGDTARYAGDAAHVIENTGESNARALLVVGGA